MEADSHRLDYPKLQSSGRMPVIVPSLGKCAGSPAPPHRPQALFEQIRNGALSAQHKDSLNFDIWQAGQG